MTSQETLKHDDGKSKSCKSNRRCLHWYQTPSFKHERIIIIKKKKNLWWVVVSCCDVRGRNKAAMWRKDDKSEAVVRAQHLVWWKPPETKCSMSTAYYNTSLLRCPPGCCASQLRRLLALHVLPSETPACRRCRWFTRPTLGDSCPKKHSSRRRDAGRAEPNSHLREDGSRIIFTFYQLHELMGGSGLRRVSAGRGGWLRDLKEEEKKDWAGGHNDLYCLLNC